MIFKFGALGSLLFLSTLTFYVDLLVIALVSESYIELKFLFRNDSKNNKVVDFGFILYYYYKIKKEVKCHP